MTVTAARKGLSTEEKLDRWKQALSAITSREEFQRWLVARRRFHRYSWGNQLLIAFQAPDARKVAGKKLWWDLGYKIRKGSKAIYIWAPSTRKVEDPDTGEQGRALSGFRLVAVFPDSAMEPARDDAEPIENPAPPQPLVGDSMLEVLASLILKAEVELDVEVRFEPEVRMGGALGFYDRSAKRIALSHELSPNHKLAVLVHECCHALGVSYDTHDRPTAEAIVETAAWCVCQSLGLDTTAQAAPYVAGWKPDMADDERAMDVQLIDRLASTVEGWLR